MLGVAPLFPRCQQVPRLTAGASFALVASQACGSYDGQRSIGNRGQSNDRAEDF